MPEAKQYDPTNPYGRFEKIPRHGAHNKKSKKRQHTLASRLNAMRTGTVGGLKKHGKKKGE